MTGEQFIQCYMEDICNDVSEKMAPRKDGSRLRLFVRKFFGRKLFRPKKFSAEKVFGRKMFGQNIFGRKSFRQKKFSTEKCFDQKFRCPYRRRRKQWRNSESSALKSHDTPGLAASGSLDFASLKMVGKASKNKFGRIPEPFA